MITIADMASKSKDIGYDTLMTTLNIKDLRELEDLIIDCFYNELLKGKLDQKNKQLHVDYTYGRDVRSDQLDSMLETLNQWDSQLEKAQHLVERQISECNQNIGDNYERQLKLEFELRGKRENMLKSISEGKEDEMMGESGLSMGGGRKGQKKDNWGGGLMSGIKQGFFNNAR